jgi:HEPN domain-containing protein
MGSTIEESSFSGLLTRVEIGHAASPIRICYYHALELYLKALLREKHSVKKIKEKFGHNTKRLVEEAEELGLVVTDEDREVFSNADTDAIIEARYVRTGARSWPELEELRHTCKRVRDGVGDLLFRAGVPVWL